MTDTIHADNPLADRVLTAQAVAFLEGLHAEFEARRRAILAAREARQASFDRGLVPTFLTETAAVREGDWSVAPAPADLQDRRTEITGPVSRKMLINALNSGAKTYMADLEDSLSPTWENVLDGHRNLYEAVRRTIALDEPTSGKVYRLNADPAVLIVRPRGWHLTEKHLLVNGQAISASLFDFGLHFFHNAKELIARGSGPYFYLPKLESHVEARLWNDVFVWAQDAIGIPRGTVRATVLIETLPAAFEMQEILYELREHASGLNAGRWDYIFSLIKVLRKHEDKVLVDRAQVTMTVPFMRAYAELLVQTCHKRGAHAIGGMAAFIPSRRDPEVNRVAFTKVREDKQREASQGFDGTWVAHPDLVPLALEVFTATLGDEPHQKHVLREDVRVSAGQLVDTAVPGGSVSEAGIRNNISVALQYIAAWLDGLGAVAIYNLMEDAATAEISRAQLWQWRKVGIELEDGTKVSRALYERLIEEEVAKLPNRNQYTHSARAILTDLINMDEFDAFLTLRAYEALTADTHVG